MADGDSVQRLNIRIQEDSLQCLKDGREVWRMPIHALLLIAEYTTGQGPFIDDYFLNFWTFENSEFIKYSISFYADGRDATFEALAQRLGAELQSASQVQPSGHRGRCGRRNWLAIPTTPFAN